jgi:hypothetical protein
MEHPRLPHSSRQQFLPLQCIRADRDIIERQIEGRFEFDDVVDLGPHRDIGDAFENELDHDRHAMLLDPLARGRESGLRIVGIADTDRLAAEPLGDRDVIDAVATAAMR